eukprot:scaffold803_cov310-Pinguiococcus_pyrenoidosus.AAC.149
MSRSTAWSPHFSCAGASCHECTARSFWGALTPASTAPTIDRAAFASQAGVSFGHGFMSLEPASTAPMSLSFSLASFR